MRRTADLSVRVLSGAAWVMLPFTTAALEPDIAVDRCAGVEIYVVTIDLPHATPQTVERQVTMPIENAVNTIPGIRKIRSNSWEGRSQTYIEVARDNDGAIGPRELQSVVSRLVLPVSTTAPTVTSARCIDLVKP